MPSRSTISRRYLLAGAGLLATCVWLPGRASAETAGDGFRILRARPGTARLRGPDQPATAIWGYDGSVPGPLLRFRRGEEARIRLVNELPESTTVHWHGLRIANAMDGVPHMTQAPIPAGGSFDYRFTPPDAGTYWYHPHVNTSEQLERGLSGLLIVDEPEPPDIDRDIALVFDDWRLRPDGAVDEATMRSFHDAAHAGRIGRHLTVNGQPSLDIPVRANERIRLRLANVGNARIIGLRLDRHQPVVMAIDGQPAEPFPARDGRVVLAPGSRIDLFVDATLAPGASADLTLESPGASATTIARLVYGTDVPARPEPRPSPAPLPANPLPATMDFRGAFRLDVPIDGGAMRMMMGGGTMGPGGRREVPGHGIAPQARVWTLAGSASSGHDGPPLFSIRRGRTAMLAFANRTAFAHAMHVHGHHFRLLDRLDDGWKPYWLDTVLVAPDQTARIAFVADNPGKWMIHCHMLEHQETGMAAWFEVT